MTYQLNLCAKGANIFLRVAGAYIKHLILFSFISQDQYVLKLWFLNFLKASLLATPVQIRLPF